MRGRGFHNPSELCFFTVHRPWPLMARLIIAFRERVSAASGLFPARSGRGSFGDGSVRIPTPFFVDIMPRLFLCVASYTFHSMGNWMTHIPSEHCAGYWCLFSLCPGPVRRILRAGTRSDQELESKKEEGNLTERRNWPVCPWIRWVHNKEEKFPIHCKGEHHDWSGRGPVPWKPPNPFISLESKTKKTIAVPRVHSHLPFQLPVLLLL